MNPAVVRIRNIGRRLGERTIWIDRVDIPRGKLVAIVGASGAGKSTLLHMIGGLIRPDWRQGANIDGVSEQQPTLEVVFTSDGQGLVYDIRKGSTRALQERISFVFQSPYLLQSATGSANIALGAYAARRAVFPYAMGQMADELNIDRSFLGDRSSVRSGGERQRIALGRAFARSPNLILADEPTANLDPALAEEIIRVLVRWSAAAADRTTIWVTHDVHLAAKFADAIVTLRDGRLADGNEWPCGNPRDPAIIRRWIDGKCFDLQSATSPRSAAAQQDAEGPEERDHVGCEALPVVPATKWERLRFWIKLGVAQVFDGVGADRVRLLREWVALPRGQDTVPISASNWRARIADLYRLVASFGSKMAVCWLALFLISMLTLRAELAALSQNIRGALLTPTMNPVVISSRNTINDIAINEAKELLTIERGDIIDVPEAFGRYELGDRRVSALRDEAASALRPESCLNLQNRIDREVPLGIAALDPNEPMLRRMAIFASPKLAADRRGITNRFDGFWSVWMSQTARAKVSQVLGVDREVKYLCLEVRGIWLTGEITGVMEGAARGRFGPYDLIISGTQWRDFGPADDRDYYQSAAVYFDAEPTYSRELVQKVRLRALEISDPPNTRLVQSLANEAAFERVSAALDRTLLMQVIVGVLGSLSIVMLVIIICAYVSNNFRDNVKPICVAIALGAGLPEIGILQVTRISLVAVPAAIVSAVAITCLSAYRWKSATHVLSEFWVGIPTFLIGTVLLTAGASVWWFLYLKRRPLAEQLKELE